MRGAFEQLLRPVPLIWVGRKRSKRPENEAEAVYMPLSRSQDYKYHPTGRCHVRARPKQIGRQK